jgi:hypothetical protein
MTAVTILRMPPISSRVFIAQVAALRKLWCVFFEFRNWLLDLISLCLLCLVSFLEHQLSDPCWNHACQSSALHDKQAADQAAAAAVAAAVDDPSAEKPKVVVSKADTADEKNKKRRTKRGGKQRKTADSQAESDEDSTGDSGSENEDGQSSTKHVQSELVTYEIHAPIKVLASVFSIAAPAWFNSYVLGSFSGFPNAESQPILRSSGAATLRTPYHTAGTVGVG